MIFPIACSTTPAEERFIAAYREIMRLSQNAAHHADRLVAAHHMASEGRAGAPRRQANLGDLATGD